MERTLEILEEKNRHLEKFYRLNETEILKFAEGNFDQLEDFYDSREGILELVRRMDLMLEQENLEAIEAREIDAYLRKQVMDSISYKNELVSRILGQDLQILSFIETAKSNIIKELCEVKAAKKAVGAYKSGQVTQRLDEKA